LSKQPEQVQEDLSRIVGQNVRDVRACNVSGNNKNYFFICNGDALLIKYYFAHPQDKRDRLATEWSFLSYLQQKNIPDVPRPVLKSQDHNAAVYTFLGGTVPRIEDVSTTLVGKAAQFINMINRGRFNEHSAVLPDASESNINPHEFMANIEKRLALITRQAEDRDNPSLAEISTEMQSLFDRKKNELVESIDQVNSYFEGILHPDQRCLSPSDYGFHNTLLDHGNVLSFIDFEYAGWDDPAKLICDFVLHPGVTINAELGKTFAEHIDLEGINKEKLLHRCSKLYELIGLKWCCIILNIFIPEHRQRRIFANPDLNIDQEEAFQIEKAQKMLNKISKSLF